jgi:hypothetical protein
MIDIATENLVHIADVPKLPFMRSRRRGKNVNIATVWRWRAVGLRGVKLEVTRMGGAIVTSVEALQRFFRAIDATYGEPVAAPSRERSVRDAERVLEKAGI